MPISRRLKGLPRRVSFMGAGEIAWRAGKEFLKARRKLQFSRPRAAQEAVKILTPELLTCPASIAGELRGEAVPDPDEWQAELNWLDQGYWKVFGSSVSLESLEGSRWSRDPLTGYQWPDTFSADIALPSAPRDTEPRTVWELSRLAYCCLYVLNRAPWSLESGLANCRRMVSSWHRGNPVYRGVHWTSGMEAAIRLLHLIWTIRLLQRSNKSEADRLFREWWSHLCIHAGFIKENLSLFSSANNHLLVELSALLAFSSLMETLPSKWDLSRQKWESDLKFQLNRQFDPQGVHREHSSCYQRFVLQALSLIDASQAVVDEELRKQVEGLLRRGWEFVTSLESGRETVFTFGDCDDARLFHLRPRHQDGGSTGCARNYSGYLTGETGFWKLFLDAAEEGLSPLFGHAHSDLFSVQIAYRSALVVGDPGTYTYLGDPDVRDTFRKRKAHSVFGPRCWEPVKFYGTFMAEPAEGYRLSKVEKKGEWIWLWARHEQHPHYALERAVLCHPAIGVVIADRLARRSSHDAPAHWESRLRFAPQWAVKKEDDGLVLMKKHKPVLRVSVSSFHEMSTRLEQRPYSECFQHLEKAPTAVFEGRGEDEVHLVTLICDSPRVALSEAKGGFVIKAGSRQVLIETDRQDCLGAICGPTGEATGSLIKFKGRGRSN